MANRKKRYFKHSKYLGVGMGCNNGKLKWRARIKINKKTIHLGWFNQEIDAAIAYNEAAIKYHKEFANINILYE